MIRSMFMATALGLAPSAMAQDLIDPGDTIQESVSIQVTNQGLDALEGVVLDLVPQFLGPDLLDLSGVDIPILDNLQPILNVTGIDIVPGDMRTTSTGNRVPPARILLRAAISLQLNTQQEPYGIDFFICSGNGWTNPIPVTADILLELDVGAGPGGTRVWDVYFDIPSEGVNIGNIQMNGDCGWADFLLNALSDVISDRILSGEVENILNQDAAPALEDALSALNIEQELDVLDKTLNLALSPKSVLSSNADGLEFRLSSSFWADPDPCVAKYDDPPGSLWTVSGVPPASANPVGTQLGIYAADELVNQALYAAFRGGILCLTVDEELLGDGLPIPLDSSLITLVGGDAYEEILPAESKPLVIQTLPKAKPTAFFDGDKPLTLDLKDFELGFYTEVDYRVAKVIGVDLNGQIGIDLPFDGTTGELAVDLSGVNAEALDVSVSGDVFVKGSEADIVTSFGGLLGTILDTFLGPLTEDLAFALPAFEGLGLTSLQLDEGGAQGDWLFASATVGQVAYAPLPGEGGGCGCGGDTQDSSCGGGCASGRTGNAAWLVLVGVLWGTRRRR